MTKRSSDDQSIARKARHGKATESTARADPKIVARVGWNDEPRATTHKATMIATYRTAARKADTRMREIPVSVCVRGGKCITTQSVYRQHHHVVKGIVQACMQDHA